MKAVLSALVVATVVTVAFAPVAAAQGRTIGDRIDDATITAQVKAKLVADQARNLMTVDVDTRDGVVHLRGDVRSEQESVEAERLARTTDGVREVKNELTVTGRASDRAPEPPASPATR